MTQQQQRFVVRTQIEVAEFFDVDRSTVCGWSAKGMPGGRRGPYDLSNISKWLFSVGPWRSETMRDAMLQRVIEGEQAQREPDEAPAARQRPKFCGMGNQ